MPGKKDGGMVLLDCQYLALPIHGQAETHGIGIGEFVGNPSDKSPLIVGGVVIEAGLLTVFVTCE